MDAAQFASGANGFTFDIARSVWDSRIATCMWVVGYTVLVYDYVVTFRKEITYIWSSPLSLGVILFYLNRYLPAVDFAIFSYMKFGAMTDKRCSRIGPIFLWFMTIGFLVTSAILLLRTYALWGRRRMILCILAPLSIIVSGAIVVLVGMQTVIPSVIFNPVPGHPDLTRCSPSDPMDQVSSQRLLAVYLLIILNESAVVILTAIKAKEHLQQSSSQWVYQIYQNGIVFCFAILGMSALNTAMAVVGSDGLEVMFLPLQRNLHSVFCNRVVFLIMENRMMRDPVQNEGATTDVFSTLTHDCDGETDSVDRWQDRSRREWIR